MTTYKINAVENQDLGTVEAETARDALDAFCENHPDDDFGFARGGLNCDTETRGRIWASQKTDGGRITATIQNP